MQGVDLTDEELLGYISESSTMSKSIEEYEGAPAALSATRGTEHALLYCDCQLHGMPIKLLQGRASRHLRYVSSEYRLAIFGFEI